MLEVLKIGTPVRLKVPQNASDGIPAVIVGVCIYQNNRISYQCVWYDDRTRNEVWLEPLEIVPETNDTFQIGFK